MARRWDDANALAARHAAVRGERAGLVDVRAHAGAARPADVPRHEGPAPGSRACSARCPSRWSPRWARAAASRAPCRCSPCRPSTAWRSSAPTTASPSTRPGATTCARTRTGEVEVEGRALGVPGRRGGGRAPRAHLAGGAAHLPRLHRLRQARRAAADLGLRPRKGLGPRDAVGGWRCTEGRDSPAFRALSDVVLAIASEREVEPVLQRLVHSRARARRRALRRARGARRRGRVRALHHVGDERRADRGDGAAAAHARAARRDARVARAVPDRRHPHATRASAAGGRARTRTCARSSACRSSRAGG